MGTLAYHKERERERWKRQRTCKGVKRPLSAVDPPPRPRCDTVLRADLVVALAPDVAAAASAVVVVVDVLVTSPLLSSICSSPSPSSSFAPFAFAFSLPSAASSSSCSLSFSGSSCCCCCLRFRLRVALLLPLLPASRTAAVCRTALLGMVLLALLLPILALPLLIRGGRGRGR